jgi:hypothetical protein
MAFTFPRALVIAAAIALCAAASAAAAPRSFYGVASQTPLSAKEYERMGEGRVGTLRSMLSWRSIDPSKAPGDHQWGSFDDLVASAARNGLRVLPFVYGSPDWAARGLDRRRCGGRCELYAPRRAAARSAFAEFVGAAVDRYGRGGEFWAEHPNVPREPIRAWQIWNEQNSRTFYRPRPTVKGYAKLLDAAARAVHSRDRRADVVLGGMAELAGSDKAVAASRYLSELYGRRGTRRDFDGVAIHPYGGRLAAVRRQTELIRDRIRAAGDGSVGLWVTEIGWSSGAGADPLEVGRRGQARKLSQAYRYFRSHRGALNAKLVSWFSWRDSATTICSWCARSGLFTKALSPKPAWRAFARLSGGR